MKQKLKRFMAGFMAMLTLVGTLFTNGTTAFAASPQANIAFWNASVKNSGEISELKPDIIMARFCIQFLTEILHIV